MTKRSHKILRWIAVAAGIHLIYRGLLLYSQWPLVEITWLSDEWRPFSRHPVLAITDFLLRPLIVWLVFALLVWLDDRRMRHRSSATHQVDPRGPA